MLRDKKLIILSHCILNQNSVVCPLARAKGAFGFVKQLVEEGVGIIQLPCPEFRYLGITRKPMNKEEYDSFEYRIICRELFRPVFEDIKIYLENGYEIKGVIGVNESPTCSITGNRGIFYEEIFNMLEKSNIKLPYCEVPEDYEDDIDDGKMYAKIKERFKL